jgi:endonuclease/exonuclease/phosphatase family metal-dependent hydrolase
MRVCSYNLEWLNENTDPAKLERIGSVLKAIQPHVIAVQEVQGRAALKRVFDDSWEIGIKDDPIENQEVGIAVKQPYRLVDYDTIFPSASLDEAFPGGRDVLRAVVKAPDETEYVFYVLHMKSRSGGRRTTDIQRIMAAGLLASYLRGKPEENSVVLGDLNDGPDDQSVNVLESGDLNAAGGRFSSVRPFLVNLAEPLYDQDYVTHGLAELFKGNPVSPRVIGSKEENERWRGKDYDFRRDTKIHQTLLDQILIRPSLKDKTGAMKVYAGNDALAGLGGRTRRNDDLSVQYLEQATRASDHLPIYVDISR